MSDKYTIRNCPAYNEKGCLYSAAIFPDESMQNRYITFAAPCQDCTDCVLKQIVELCKKIIFLNGGTDFTDVDMYKHSVGENFVARQVLKLLDIEECGDES